MRLSRLPVVFRCVSALGLVTVSLTLASLPVAASATTKINYLAMGDSYSSGEGLAAQASGYINDPYITGRDGCHRASNAYPELVKKSFGSSLNSFKFVACSGAYSGETTPVNENFDKGGSMVSGRDNEAPQLSTTYLKSSVNDISLTIGGNDAGFSNVAASCTSVMFQTGPVKKVMGLPPFMTGGSCASMEAQSKLVIGNGTAMSELGQGLVKTYETILNDATNARLAVLTYPQLLNPKQIPTGNFCPLTSGAVVGTTGETAYLGFNSNVQGAINDMESGVNSDIASAVAMVASLPQYQGRIRLVNVTSTTIPQPCNTKSMSTSDINGIDFAPGEGFAQLVRCITRSSAGASCDNFISNFISNGTLHPTEAGHQRMANALEVAFKADWNASMAIDSEIRKGVFNWWAQNPVKWKCLDPTQRLLHLRIYSTEVSAVNPLYAFAQVQDSTCWYTTGYFLERETSGGLIWHVVGKLSDSAESCSNTLKFSHVPQNVLVGFKIHGVQAGKFVTCFAGGEHHTRPAADIRWEYAPPNRSPIAFSRFMFTGDSTGLLEGMRWSEWTMDQATGTGTLSNNQCVPNCAQGKWLSLVVEVVLNHPVQTQCGAFYTNAVFYLEPSSVKPSVTKTPKRMVLSDGSFQIANLCTKSAM